MREDTWLELGRKQLDVIRDTGDLLKVEFEKQVGKFPEFVESIKAGIRSEKTAEEEVVNDDRLWWIIWGETANLLRDAGVDEEGIHFLAEGILRDLRVYEEAKREEALEAEAQEDKKALEETAEHLAQMIEEELKVLFGEDSEIHLVSLDEIKG